MKKSIAIILILSAFLLIPQVYSAAEDGTNPAYDKSEFIFRDELVPGMEGYALTVIDGIRIDRIDVRLKAIIKDICFNGRDMLLIETSGNVIDYTHGIAGGMSGSPIYFDNRLAGAISGHWLYTDQRTGIGTPIEYMLENLDYEGGYVDSYDDPLPYGPSALPDSAGNLVGDTIAIAADNDEASRLVDKLGGNHMVFVEAAAPIFIEGVDPDTISTMKESIEEEFNGEVTDIPVIFPENVEIPEKMEPGAALAILWSRGDIQYGNFGTVTYVTKDGRVLGFGHSMGRRGRTEVPMAYGYMYGRRPSLQRSTKYGGPTKVCGVITQDRGGAISGYVGVEPKFVPMHVTTTVNGLEPHDYLSEVAGSRFYFPDVCAVVAKSSILRGTPRILGGTLKVAWRMDFEGRESIDRHDIYTGTDPVSAFGNDLTQAAVWAVDNRFERLEPIAVKITADYNPEETHIRIIDAYLVDENTGLVFRRGSQEATLIGDDGLDIAATRYIGRKRDVFLTKEDSIYIFHPGDQVFVHITAKPSYGEIEHFLYRVIIPDGKPDTTGRVQIRGGGNLIPGVELVGQKAFDDLLSSKGKLIGFPPFIDSKASTIKWYNDRFASDDLVVECILDTVKDAADIEEANGLYVSVTERQDAPVLGVVTIDFKIAKEEEKKEGPAADKPVA